MLRRLHELDRVRGRAQRVVGLREGEPGIAYELPDAVETRPGRQLPELLLRPVEAEDVEVPPQEAPVAAVEDQSHVTEVRLDVRGLELAVQRVDQRLHLLRHPRREAAVGGLEHEPRAPDHGAEVGDEAARNRDRGDDLAGAQLARRLLVREPDELHVVADARDRAVDVEPVAAEDEQARQVVLVHERDVLRDLVDDRLHVEALARDLHDARHVVLVDVRHTRLGARVARDEADETGDHERIREQDDEQQRRAAEHPQVLPQEQKGVHAKKSIAGSRS